MANPGMCVAGSTPNLSLDFGNDSHRSPELGRNPDTWHGHPWPRASRCPGNTCKSFPISRMCPTGQPLNSRVVATVWRRTWAVTFFLILDTLRKRRNQVTAVSRASRRPRRTEKRASAESERRVRVFLDPVQGPGAEGHHPLLAR